MDDTNQRHTSSTWINTKKVFKWGFYLLRVKAVLKSHYQGLGPPENYNKSPILQKNTQNINKKVMISKNFNLLEDYICSKTAAVFSKKNIIPAVTHGGGSVV